jgi:zinc-ribbon domain
VAGFCVNCGAPLSEGAKFCSKCGTTVAPSTSSITGTAAPSSVAPGAPAPVAQGSNTVVKVIIGVVAAFVLLMMSAAGACFYMGYRAKQRIQQFSRQMDSEATPYRGKREPCAMLSTSEAAKALGEKVISVEQRGITSCAYLFGQAGKGMDIEYTWQGGAMTMRLAHGAVKQISGTETFTIVPGIGDEAYIAPDGSALLMRKGDVMVNLELRTSGISVDAAKKVASTIAQRL